MTISETSCVRIQDARRAHALSKGGLRWWVDGYYRRSGDRCGNRSRPSVGVLSTEENQRRVRALLREMRSGLNPRLCTLLVFFACVLALAKARDFVAVAKPSGEGLSAGPEAPYSLLADQSPGRVAGNKSTWPTEDQVGNPEAEAEDSLNLGPIEGAPSGGIAGFDRQIQNRRDRERSLDGIPESAPVTRDLGRDTENLRAGVLLNRPIDEGSPHWWQNLRQDGRRGFGGAAESQQSLFSQNNWSDWHGGAGRRGSYSHSPVHGADTIVDPDLSVGPLEVDLVAFLSSEYTDNRGLTSEDKASGFLLAAGINTKGAIDLTEEKQLHFNVGVGVDQFFGDDTEDDGLQLHVTPDSFLDFTFAVGDLEVRLFDRFSMQRNRRLSSFSPDAIDTGDFWSNVVGASALYPLNDALSAHALVDFSRDEALDGEFDPINNDTVTGSAGLTLSPRGEYTLGVHGTWSQRDYDTDFNNDADVASVGGFGHRPITEFSRIEANAGYQTFDFSSSGRSADSEQLSDYYVSAAIRNELNEMMTHSLLGGHGADFGALSNFESFDFVRYEVTAEPTAATTVDLALGYRWNDESGPRDARDETFNAMLQASHRLTDHIVVGVRGAFSQNTANLEGRDFEEKRLQAYARLHLNESTNVNLSYQRWDVGKNADGYVENSIVSGLSVDF